MPNVPDQSYCPEPACQRERRKLWQRQHRSEDPSYRENQARAQEAWLARNPDYWRDYRVRHPEYTERNRERQRLRAKERRGTPVAADLEAFEIANLLSSGVYRLTVIAVERVAKMDACFVVKLVRVKGTEQV